MINVKHPSKIRVLEPLIILILTIFGLIYAVNLLNTGDWLWFQSQTVNARPDKIRIRYYGQETIIQSGHPDYLPLAKAIDTSLKKFTNNNLIDLGLSQSSLDYYETDGVLVELFYDNPVKFHASFRTGKPTELLIPVQGRHAGKNYFFRGANGEWWYGAMRMADSTALYKTLEDLGYLHDVEEG